MDYSIIAKNLIEIRGFKANSYGSPEKQLIIFILLSLNIRFIMLFLLIKKEKEIQYMFQTR